MGVYQQVAVIFADLHDRAERMQEKGVITVIILFCSILVVIWKMFTLNKKVI